MAFGEVTRLEETGRSTQPKLLSAGRGGHTHPRHGVAVAVPMRKRAAHKRLTTMRAAHTYAPHTHTHTRNKHAPTASCDTPTLFLTGEEAH